MLNSETSLADRKLFEPQLVPRLPNWFQGSALEPTESQAPPAVPTGVDSRLSMRSEALLPSTYNGMQSIFVFDVWHTAFEVGGLFCEKDKSSR